MRFGGSGTVTVRSDVGCTVGFEFCCACTPAIAAIAT